MVGLDDAGHANMYKQPDVLITFILGFLAQQTLTN
jgi:hypothetical protein